MEEMRNKNKIMFKRNKALANALDATQGRVKVLNGIVIMLITIEIVMWLIKH